MPVMPENIARVGDAHITQVVTPGEWIPGSRNVLLEQEDTSFWLLSDIIVVRNPSPWKILSVGDFLILSGLAVTLAGVAAMGVRSSAQGRRAIAESYAGGRSGEI